MKEYPINQDNLRALSLDALRWRCDLEILRDLSPAVKNTDLNTPNRDQAHLSEHLTDQGKIFFTPQEAEEAIKLGLHLNASGYHIFVSGPSGSGKSSAIKSILNTSRRPPTERFDFVYLHHFEDADRPRLCKLPPGKGRVLKRRLIQFVDSLAELVVGALHSTRLENRRRALMRQLEEALIEALHELGQDCEQKGFVFVHSPEDFGASEIKIKVSRRKTLSLDEWLGQVQLGKIKGAVDETLAQHEELTEHLHTLWDELSRLEWELNRHIENLELQEVQARVTLRASDLFFPVLEEADLTGADLTEADLTETGLTETGLGVDDTIEAAEALEVDGAEEENDEQSDAREDSEDEAAHPLYADVNREISIWLRGLLDWFEEHLDELKDVSGDNNLDFKDLRLLRANVIHEAPAEAPIIYETSPTLINLLGTIERSGDDNHAHLDFGDIRSGSLLKANGGILVVNANDLSQEGTSTWRFLLRALKDQSLEIQSPDQLFASGGSPIKPTPIPLDVKVIAIGDDELYRALFLTSEDFCRVFKVKAEFDDSLPNDNVGLSAYLKHASLVQREERLRPFSIESLGLWCEYGTRLSGRRDRLSTQLGQLTDVLREAHFYAVQSESAEVTQDHMRRALQARFDRHSMVEKHLGRLITSEVIELTPEGREVGVVHGLTVLDFGDHVCGYPCRISATHTPGEYGVVSIERESGLSGSSHDKGALNVSAYLRSRFSPDEICALYATLNFDQVHEEVDGDSASLAELLALISSLSNMPINQSLAITGAIDQRGHVQAVGGINEKIEGFFKTCQERGLTGAQGVIIPRSTLGDLALKRAVLEAVEEGSFNVWAVQRVDEALALIFADPASLSAPDSTSGSASRSCGLDIKESEAVIREVSERVSERLGQLLEVAARYRHGRTSS